MDKEYANYSHPLDCQWRWDYRRVAQEMTAVNYPLSNLVVTRQDSCSSDVSLCPEDGISINIDGISIPSNDTVGLSQMSSPFCKTDLLHPDTLRSDLNGQTQFGIIHKNIPCQQIENIMLKICPNGQNTKPKQETAFNYGKLPVNPNIIAREEVFFDNLGKDNSFPSHDSKVQSEFQPISMMPTEFGNAQSPAGLRGKSKTVFEPRLQEFHQRSYQHPLRTYTIAGDSGAISNVLPTPDKWSPRARTSYVIFIILLFGLAVCYARLQVRVGHLEEELQVLSNVIQKFVQASSDIPNDVSMTPTSDSNVYKESTSERIGFIDSLLIYREDPTRNVRLDTPQSGHREFLKLYNAQRKIPAADEGLDTSVLSGDKPPSKNTWESIRTSGSIEVTPDSENGLYDKEALKGDLKSNTLEADSDLWDSSLLSPSLALSRSKRNADTTSDKEKELNKYCERKVCKKDNKQVLKAHLPSEQFIGDFYHIYDYNKDFLNKSRDCFQDTSLPTRPYVCKEATIKYPHQDSVLAVYRHVKENTGSKKESKKNKKSCGTPLLEIANETSGDFRVKVPGIYSIHVNITVVSDEHGNHSLALFLNGHAMLACPNGGFRCPKTNEPGSFKYRICNMHGLLELSEKDVIQIRTLNKDTVVRLENHRQSQFKAVLLHQSTKGNKKGRC